MPSEKDIKAFWQSTPVDEINAGDLEGRFAGNWANVFEAYDKWRYTHQAHILQALDKFDWKDQRVLEIGLGQGADSEQLIQRGARWSGIDVTPKSVERLMTHCMKVRYSLSLSMMGVSMQSIHMVYFTMFPRSNWHSAKYGVF